MKVTFPSLVVLLGMGVLVAAGARASEVAEQFKAAQAALRPSSDEAARNAVIQYFAAKQTVPPSAGYAFNPIANGIVRASSLEEAGWFMCGNVSLAAGEGKAGALAPFIAYFDPQNPDTVRDGAVEGGNFEIVSAWCRNVYGLNYLPRSR